MIFFIGKKRYQLLLLDFDFRVFIRFVFRQFSFFYNSAEVIVARGFTPFATVAQNSNFFNYFSTTFATIVVILNRAHEKQQKDTYNFLFQISFTKDLPEYISNNHCNLLVQWDSVQRNILQFPDTNLLKKQHKITTYFVKVPRSVMANSNFKTQMVNWQSIGLIINNQRSLIANI